MPSAPSQHGVDLPSPPFALWPRHTRHGNSRTSGGQVEPEVPAIIKPLKSFVLQRQGSPEAERLLGSCPGDLKLCTHGAFPCLPQSGFSCRHFQQELRGSCPQGCSWSIPSPTRPSATREVPRVSRRLFPSIPGTEAVWAGVWGLPAAHPVLESSSGVAVKDSVLWESPVGIIVPFCRRCLGLGLCCCCWEGCRFGFLGSMSLDLDGKKLAFHESLSLII